MKSDTQTLIDALRILARDAGGGDGVANACIAEAADRLEELTIVEDNRAHRRRVDSQSTHRHRSFAERRARLIMER